ncbi:MAG: hypothetical protein ABIL58_27110 [Pseudomonadota bacterium]
MIEKLSIDRYMLTNTNCRRVVLGNLVMFYSYETPVGFYHPRYGGYKTENLWGPTTGKHLRHMPGFKETVPNNRFLQLLEKAFKWTISELFDTLTAIQFSNKEAMGHDQHSGDSDPSIADNNEVGCIQEG